jgi:hypothetical protein
MNDYENLKAMLDASNSKYETWQIRWNDDSTPRDPPGWTVVIESKDNSDVLAEFDFDGNGKLLSASTHDFSRDSV